jgi:hypothetical protein
MRQCDCDVGLLDVFERTGKATRRGSNAHASMLDQQAGTGSRLAIDESQAPM